MPTVEFFVSEGISKIRLMKLTAGLRVARLEEYQSNVSEMSALYLALHWICELADLMLSVYGCVVMSVILLSPKPS